MTIIRLCARPVTRTITDPSWHPPHPLGLVDHPAWSAVRERRAELEALRIQNVPAPWWLRKGRVS